MRQGAHLHELVPGESTHSWGRQWASKPASSNYHTSFHKKNTCARRQEFHPHSDLLRQIASYMRNFLKESPELTASKVPLCKWHLRDRSVQDCWGQAQVIFLNTCQALPLQISFFPCLYPILFSQKISALVKKWWFKPPKMKGRKQSAPFLAQAFLLLWQCVTEGIGLRDKVHLSWAKSGFSLFRLLSTGNKVCWIFLWGLLSVGWLFAKE